MKVKVYDEVTFDRAIGLCLYIAEERERNNSELTERGQGRDIE